jgi:opacity protein-like surface antigen
MKFLIILLISMFTFVSYAQENSSRLFSQWKFGAMAGMNFSSLTGGAVSVEAKTNLTQNLYLKISAGYSLLNKKEGYSVKTYQHVVFTGYDKYTTGSYNVDQINYDVFPVSLGMQYVFLKSLFSPYVMFDAGYNIYTYHTTFSKVESGAGGTYDTYAELPAEYQSKAPDIPQNDSYRFALGLGTEYGLSSAINLDIRYVYQFNKSLMNTNQVLVGINF